MTTKTVAVQRAPVRGPNSAISSLRITECHHPHNQFWNLGPVVHEVPPWQLFESLTDTSCERDEAGNATHEVACYIVDACDAYDVVVADVEISRAMAEQLLDEPIPELRRRSKITWYGAGRLEEFPDGVEQA